MDWYWLYYATGVLFGGIIGVIWGTLGLKWWKKRHPDKWDKARTAIAVTASQRSKIIDWCYAELTSGQTRYFKTALVRAMNGDEGFDIWEKHYAAICGGHSPLMHYPKSLRPALFKLLYPENGNDLAKWLRVNHPQMLKDYRVARRARERLFEDA